MVNYDHSPRLTLEMLPSPVLVIDLPKLSGLFFLFFWGGEHFGARKDIRSIVLLNDGDLKSLYLAL